MNLEFKIEPKSKFGINLKELWDFRELFYYFTWRDIKVKYKQTVFGLLWAILQPLFLTVVFTLFLGDSISQKTNLKIYYPVFALSGMLLWNIFSTGVSSSANSMVNNSNIIKKIYFPRIIIPISSILVSLFDFLMAVIILVAFVFYFNVAVNYCNLIYIPLSILITCIASIGIGTFLAALNIKYRDVRYVIPYLTQSLLFITPVMYPLNISNNQFAVLFLKLNPMTGALELFRSIFFFQQPDLSLVFWSFISSLVFLFIGLLYFSKTEKYFADLV